MVSVAASLVAGRWFGWEVLQVGVRGSAAWHAAVAVERLEVVLTRNQLAVPTEVLGEHQLVLTRLQALTSATQTSEHLQARARTVQHNLSASLEWENFLANVDLDRLERSYEFKQLVRMGVPNAFRGRVWKRFVS